MRVLVVGSGGREHAICWGIAKSDKVKKIYCAPGNAGISEFAENVEIPADNINKLLEFALKEKIDFTIVGPEQPLSLGIVDLFRDNKLLIFGPSKFASQLESSKEFSKLFMERNNIPTASFKSFTSYDEAKAYLNESNLPIVIKADGLASGKGVKVCMEMEEANSFLKEIMLDKIFSKSGEKVVIESFLEGEEASFFVFSDGEKILCLDSSQDHKRLLDDDKGPNTGGMGAYSPAPIIDEETKQNILNEIINPVFEGFKKENFEYTGILYVGLMINNKKPSVVEFNCRFGDPETQPLLFRIESDIFDLFYQTALKQIDQYQLIWKRKTAISVVLASLGYPMSPETGGEIKELESFKNTDDEFVFHAGTKFLDNKVVISGGRVLNITALGHDLEDAINKVYDSINKVELKNFHYRNDIGKKGLVKKTK